jgi:hypothetical protein
MNLEDIFDHYGHPDPAIISQLEKPGGVTLAYVGHAEITKALTEIDPLWTWEPLEIRDGRPVTHLHAGRIPRRNGDPILVDMVTMWGRLTLQGVTRIAVGSVEAHKPDLDKELVSDFLRNAAMRFGVALGLWMKDTGNVVSIRRDTPPDAPRSQQNPERHPASQVLRAKPATDAQKVTVGNMANERGYEITNERWASMSAQDASDLIAHLKTLPKVTKPKKESPAPAAPETDEEPF